MTVIISALNTLDTRSLGIRNAFNNLARSITIWDKLSIIQSLAEFGNSLSSAGYYLVWITYNFNRLANFYPNTSFVTQFSGTFSAISSLPLSPVLGAVGIVGNTLRGIHHFTGLIQAIRFQNIFQKYAWRGCPPPDQPRTWTDETPKSRLLRPSLAPMDPSTAEAFFKDIKFDPTKQSKIHCYKLVYLSNRSVPTEKMVAEKDGRWKIYSPIDSEWTERDIDWKNGSYTFEELLQKLGLKPAPCPSVETIDRQKAIDKLKNQDFVLRKDKAGTISLEKALSTVAAFTFHYVNSKGVSKELKVLQHECKYLVYSPDSEDPEFYHYIQDLLETYGPLRELNSNQSREYLLNLGVAPSDLETELASSQCFQLLYMDQGKLQRDTVIFKENLYHVFSSQLEFRESFTSKQALFASYSLPPEKTKPKEDTIKLLEELASINPLVLERALPDFILEELTKTASEHLQALAEKLKSDDPESLQEAYIVLEHLGKLQEANVVSEQINDISRVKDVLRGIQNFSTQDYLKVLATKMRAGHIAALKEGSKLLEKMHAFSLRKADWMAICLIASLVAIVGCIGFFVAFPLAITLTLTILGVVLTTTGVIYRKFYVENPTGKFYPVISGFLPQFFRKWIKEQDELKEFLRQNISKHSFYELARSTATPQLAALNP